MIPYLTVPDIHIGPLTIPAFTLLVLLGTVIGAGIAVRRAREFGLSRSTFDITMTLALVGGFLGAHLFSILLYAPNLLWTDGLLILAKVWRGMSSYGGLWGALLALSLYFGRLKQPWLVHADALAQGLVVGWVFGRLGCAIAHDHIGIQSSFFLAVRYPGGARHDLGLYEFLFTLLVLLPTTQVLHRKPVQPGAHVMVLCLIYAPARFLFDFLRISNVPGADLRYWSLTPAQFSSIALLALGLWLLQGHGAPVSGFRSLPGEPQVAGLAANSLSVSKQARSL